MNTESPANAELTRIAAAYERRKASVSQDRYSFLQPGHLLAFQNLERRVLCLLETHLRVPLRNAKVLELGCGNGFWLRELLRWGAIAPNLKGIDLLPDREARRLCPPGVIIECGSAARSQDPDASFDLVLQFTMFTSVLNPQMRVRIAREMLRLLKPGGIILWYDFLVNNPWNPDVQRVGKPEIYRMFPQCPIHLERITLAPPLGRRIARVSPFLYSTLSSLKLFCTHYLGVIEKQREPEMT